MVLCIFLDLKIPDKESMRFYEFLASLIVPIIVGIFGFFVFRMNKKFEHEIALKTKVIDKRVQCYSEIANDLNDIFTYMIRVGEWKDKNPQDIIDAKRKVSKLMHTNKPLWSENVFNCYRKFILEIFENNTGHRKDAKIKADIEKYGDLRDSEKKMFTGSKADKDTIKTKYALLGKAFSEDMGINE